MVNKLKNLPDTPIPKNISPMLAALIKKPFTSSDWIFEIKWDGYRMIAQKEDMNVNIYSRKRTNFNEKFLSVYKELKSLKGEFVMDGEVVAINKEGLPDFPLLQKSYISGKGYFVYYVFDLLWFQGKTLFELPLIERKKLLKKLVPLGGCIKYVEHVDNEGENFFKLLEENKMEGMVCKKKESFYRPGIRTKDWLKVKTDYFIQYICRENFSIG